jgi:hypothetical protein
MVTMTSKLHLGDISELWDYVCTTNWTNGDFLNFSVRTEVKHDLRELRHTQGQRKPPWQTNHDRHTANRKV